MYLGRVLLFLFLLGVLGGGPSYTGGGFFCGDADYFGVRTLVLDIIDTIPAQITQLTARLYAINDYIRPVHGNTYIELEQTYKRNYPGDPIFTTPEFPSPYPPAIVIIGFLGVVLFIKRTREN